MKGGLLLNKFLKGAGFYLLLLIIIVTIVEFAGTPTETVKELNFSQVYKYLTEENISEIRFVDSTSVEGTIKDSKEKFTSYMPVEVMSDEFANEVLQQSKEGKLVFSGKPKPTEPWYIQMLPTLLLIFFMVIMWFLFMNQSQGGGGKVMNFGKSKARVHKDDEKTRVTFKDVAGLQEEKEDLSEVVDFLKNPKRYIELGARIPKGILMVGPPGTGKTYLSRAVAGEAGVPFFTISGSDFVEMFVGVGASRVRDLFENAKKNAPSIIFIDEIDAVGRRRGNGMGGGHDEREQTLNQLLVEMDGFAGDEGVIVMAATNRSDVLDPALLRPGRFDRKILVGRPDVKGREAILKVHARNKPLANDVDLKEIAKQTPGFVGADLENLLNEAALLAARRNKKQIDASDVDEAEDRVIAGPAKKDRVISKRERETVAYHEAGHTIVGLVLNDARVVHKVTIVPRGRAGGYAIMLPKEDQMLMTKKDAQEQIAGLMGGRAAEQIIFGTQSSGASNDFQQATQIARAMVTQYGMSEKLGPVQYEGQSGMFAGDMVPGNAPFSAQTANLIDSEVKRLAEEGMQKATEIIEAHREQHKLIAEALLKYETLDEKQILSLFKTGKMPQQTQSEFPSERAATFEEAKKAFEQRDAARAKAAEKEERQKEEAQQAEDDQPIDFYPQDKDRN